MKQRGIGREKVFLFLSPINFSYKILTKRILQGEFSPK